MAMLEAAACELPIVVVAVGVDARVAHDNGLMVDEGDIPQLSQRFALWRQTAHWLARWVSGVAVWYSRNSVGRKSRQNSWTSIRRLGYRWLERRSSKVSVNDRTPKDYFQEPSHYFDYDHRYNVLVRQILIRAQGFPHGPTILDIGCGSGIAQLPNLQHEISAVAGEYWAVEPDPDIEVVPVFRQTWRTTFEEAAIPTASIDIAYCYMVLEHIVNPVAFLGQLARILSPGGVFLAVTINAESIFGRLSRWTHQVRLQDKIVQVLRGKKSADSYHYPAVYRLNSNRQFQSIVAEQLLPMNHVEVSYLERGEMNPYLRGLLTPCQSVFNWYVRRRPNRYTSLLIRLRANAETD